MTTTPPEPLPKPTPARGYSFVTPAALKAYMSGINLEVDQQAALQDVLDGVQRELERYCRRQFERRERTETIRPDAAGRLWPKATPVVSVSAPVGLYGAGNQILGSWDMGYPGLLAGIGAGVTVTYVGGLDPEDDDLHDVQVAILRVAAREAEVRHDDVLDPTDLEARNPAKHDKRQIGWTDDELKKFDRLRRRTVV